MLLVGLAVVFLVQAAPRLSAPFGDSHDGENGAVWGLASRAIRDDGFFASRAGAHLADGEGLYAHHPPLIAIETAAIEEIAGEHPASTRAPAWLGSLAAIPLLYLLLRALRLRRVPSALGVVLGLSCPMFLLYGSMLDTFEISLPFMLGFLVLRARADIRDQPSTSWVVFGVATLVVVSSWQGALLCATFSALDGCRALRRHRRVRLSPTICGFIVGVGAVALWLWWATGSFAGIFNEAQARSGSSTHAIGWLNFFEFQGIYLGALVGPIIILGGVFGLVVLLRQRRTRALTGCVVFATVGYTLLLRDGASNHDYWNYWLLVPLAMGLGAAIQQVLHWLSNRYDSDTLGPALVATICAVSLALGISASTPARDQYQNGLTAIRLAQQMEAQYPTQNAYVIGHFGADVRWADYQLPSRPRRVRTLDEIRDAASHQPNAPVLVECPRRTAVLDPICSHQPSTTQYLVTTLATLAAQT